jgi:hypothetical protein
MASMTPWAIVWRARLAGLWILRRAGWSGLAVVSLFVVAIGVWLVEIATADELARAKQAAVIDALQAASVRASAHARTRSPQHDLEAFEAHLPQGQERMQVLSDLFQLAEEHKLVLARGEYQLQHDEKAQLDSFRITLPVKGDPAAVQRFLQGALTLNRALAFEALTLKREQIDGGAVEAKVQFLLFLRQTPGATALPSVVAGGAQ